ncbi:MAG: ABC transporter substrate-binding protein [Caulobacteraceae bacterium]
MALDQCADQYVLALSPRAAIVSLSERALARDSYLAGKARGLPRRRATTESVLAARPDVVVRYWGGDTSLLEDLRRRGVKVATIADAVDFNGVRANITVVSHALGEDAAGRALIAGMNRELAGVAGAWGGRGAFYLTSGDATTGGGTLIDAMLRATGLTNLESGHGYRTVSLERMVLFPPAALVLGYFDAPSLAGQRWSVGRHAAVRRLAAARTLVSLPAAVLGCPAWFAADGAASIAAAARR